MDNKRLAAPSALHKARTACGFAKAAMQKWPMVKVRSVWHSFFNSWH